MPTHSPVEHFLTCLLGHVSIEEILASMLLGEFIILLDPIHLLYALPIISLIKYKCTLLL